MACQLFGGSSPRCAATIAEVEPLAFGRSGRGRQRIPEPRVLRAAVVGDDVHHDPDAEGARVADEGVELLEIAVVGLDVEVVGDVVPVVGLRRRVARVEPDRIDAEIGEVGQAAADAGEVADAVVVRVRERPHVQLVDDRSLPPRGCSVDHVAPRGWMECADHDRGPASAGPTAGRCPRRRSGRAAHDELEREFFDERNRPGPGGERAGQDLRATLARHLQRLTHRRQAAVRGEVDVVVADDGHVARHRLAGEPRRLQHAERLDVGRGDDRRRRVCHREQFIGELTSRGAHVGAVLDVAAVEGDARVGEGVGVAVLAMPTRHEAEGVALRLTDERDAFVAERQQVLGGDPSAVAVVDHDAGQRRVRGVDQHRRELRHGEAVALVGTQRERDDDQTLELVPWNFQQAAMGAIGRVDVVQHDLETVRLQRLHDAAQTLVRRRLVEERHQHADEALAFRPAPGGRTSRAVVRAPPSPPAPCRAWSGRT